MVEYLMLFAIITSFLFSLVSFLLSQNKKYAVIALTFCTIAIALGGFTVQGRSVDKVSWSIGLDW